MSNIAIPAATLCVTRKLERIASTRHVSRTPKDIQREHYFDFGMCLVLPFVYGVLSIVYQGHRFDIYEGLGCFQPVYLAWHWVALGVVPILAVSVSSLTYSSEYVAVPNFAWYCADTKPPLLVSAGSQMVHHPSTSIHCHLGQLGNEHRQDSLPQDDDLLWP